MTTLAFQPTDDIDRPAHYTQHPIECIVFTQHLGFCLGNAFKYIWRYADKNGVQDLKKARWYLNAVIEGELPLDLDDDIWAGLNEELAACTFVPMQGQLLRTLWFLATGVGGWRAYNDLHECLDDLNVWIRELEHAVDETALPD